MASEAKVHKQIPPCSCDSCLRATAKADQQRAEIETILANLDALGLHITTADKLEKEAGE